MCACLSFCVRVKCNVVYAMLSTSVRLNVHLSDSVPSFDSLPRESVYPPLPHLKWRWYGYLCRLGAHRGTAVQLHGLFVCELRFVHSR